MLTSEQLNLVMSEQERRLEEALPYVPTQRGPCGAFVSTNRVLVSAIPSRSSAH